MSNSLVFLVLGLYITICAAQEGLEHFTNDWVVRLSGGKAVADELARELGYENRGELRGFPDTYLMRRLDHPQRARRHADHLTKRLSDDRRVQWAEQQVAKKRTKRGVVQNTMERQLPPDTKDMNRFNDELWTDQWYLHDTRSMANLPQLDLRTTPVWDMGYTGKGIVVTVMDDGLEWNHTDIIKNYDKVASFDTMDDDPDPFPRYDESDSNNHGTRCAGEIAMTANNEKCGVGVAYNAKIGGIRMLDGPVTDVVESVSLTHSLHHIDVFSASWGPNDDGMTVDGPHRLALEAFEKGIKEGRKGKGVIYVWASGNGGSKGDNCNCDGYTNSIYTLSVGSASQHGDFPWYGERCASTMTAAYSSGAYTDQKIATTDLHNKCTVHHTGTSAAAPLAAGIVALILEANPSLTWRDMQHLVVWNSEYWQVRHNRGWKKNAAGLMYNSRFGYGLMNAEAMVKAALNWTTVPAKSICKLSPSTKLPLPLSSTHNDEVEVVLPTDGCKGTSNEINFIEHVEVILNIEYNHRGALDIFLFSPLGSESMLLSRREKDSSSLGFKNWTFLSVHLWGENPAGEWKILVRDKTKQDYHGNVESVTVILHGTKDMPFHMKNGPRNYHDREIMQRTIDKTPEYDEQIPPDNEIFSDRLNELRRSEGKSRLDWNDLVGKQLRRVNFPREVAAQQRFYVPLRYYVPDFIPREKDYEYSNYYHYK